MATRRTQDAESADEARDAVRASTSAAAGLAAKAKDLETLRNAVIDAASIGSGLWLSYLFVLLYLLIAVGGVTHQDLFFEKPVKLPFLGVDLPLVGFFALGPGLFLIVHAYVLMHFVLLADKAGVFHAELQAQVPDEGVRLRLRRQLPSNVFVQVLAGPRGVRAGAFGLMLRLTLQISLVAGPIALLVFFELRFLPYHHEAITWWHRVAVVADLALLWMAWPSVARGRTTTLRWRTLGRDIRRVARAVVELGRRALSSMQRRAGRRGTPAERGWRDVLRDARPGSVTVMALASLVPVLLVFTIATFPGEWLEENLPEANFIPWRHEGGSWRWISLHQLLVAGDVDFVARKPKSLWSNNLVLPGLDASHRGNLDTEGKIATASTTVSLRGRHLERAVLIGADLRKADLTSARLQNAELDQAQLQGASLREAQLQGAKLFIAQLQGASLYRAQLQGASLDSAQLQGARLEAAQLQGASLNAAQLPAASLDRAELQGASLYAAQLYGASLDGAQLQGASLEAAQLQGASLNRTQLRGASLDKVLAFRADARQANGAGASVRVNGPTRCCLPEEERAQKAGQPPCDWSAASFEALKQQVAAGLPDGDRRRTALARIEARLDPAGVVEGEADMPKAWAALQASSPAPPARENIAVAEWKMAGCAGDHAPYVIQGLLRGVLAKYAIERPTETPSPEVSALAAIFLDERQCPGARGLTETERTSLRRIRTPPAATAAERSSAE